MRWRSTRGQAPPVSFAEALFSGLAPDGGLYLPEQLPVLPAQSWRDLVGAPVAEVATAMLAPLVGDEIPRGELGQLLAEALDFPLPLVPLVGAAGASPDVASPGGVSAAGGEANGGGLDRGDTFVLELFHGPTFAFKDVGARTMARLMAWLRAHGRRPRGAAAPGSTGARSAAPVVSSLAGSRAAGRSDGPLTVLVATSGDTGSAVAHAFYGVADTRVVVLYPRGQVSPLQERQFATLGGNVRALAVDGTFDACQRLVKEAFLDPTLRAASALTSANSINIGRLLPQSVYHAVAALLLAERGAPPWVVVPSGNFGNLAAGLIAQRMGAPLGAFVAATNANSVVPEFLAGEAYRPRPSVPTVSNAMDVGTPSNWERIVDLVGGEAAARRELTGHSVDDAATRGAIAEVARRTAYLMDPHTAVGWVAAKRERAAGRAGAAILLATAHPAKFPETVEPAVGRAVALPPALADCLDRPLLSEPLAPELAALRRALL